MNAPSGLRRRRAAGIAAAWTAFALAVLCQRYWPVMAGESAARQFSFLKAMALLPLLLSVDRIKSVAMILPGRHGPRPDPGS